MKAQGFVLRAMAADDVAALTDLWVAAWRATGLKVDFEARRDWFVARLGELAANSADIVVAAEGDGVLAGFVTIQPDSGHLDQLCVAPAWQGGGVAALLLGAAKARAPRCVRLEVNADNARARRFYRREGFIETVKGVSPASGLPTVHMAWHGARGGA